MASHATDAAAVEPIADLAERSVATVAGRVAAVTVEPRNSAPRLVVRLADGTGSVDLIFVGRRVLPGVNPGSALRAQGRVQHLASGGAIFNPRYDLGVAT